MSATCKTCNWNVSELHLPWLPHLMNFLIINTLQLNITVFIHISCFALFSIQKLEMAQSHKNSFPFASEKKVWEYSDSKKLNHIYQANINNNINGNIIHTHTQITLTVLDTFHRSIALQTLKLHRKVPNSYFLLLLAIVEYLYCTHSILIWWRDHVFHFTPLQRNPLEETAGISWWSPRSSEMWISLYFGP